MSAWVAMLGAGVLAVAASLRWRAFVTPFRRAYAPLPWEEVAPIRLDGRWRRPTACALAPGGAVLVALRPRKPGPVVASWDDSRRALALAFRLPADLRRVSALFVDGSTCLAACARSGRIARIDLPESLRRGEAVVLETIATGLRRIGGLCVLEHGGRRLLAIAERGGGRRTYLVNPQRLAALGDARRAAEASFLDLGNARGLAWDGARLWEASANVGRNLVYRIDVARAVRDGSVTFGAESTVNAPGGGVRGLIADGDRLIACDARLRMLCRTRKGGV